MSDYEMKIALGLDDANKKLDQLAGKFDKAAAHGKKLADQNAKNSAQIGKSLDGLVTKVGALGAAYLTTAGAAKAFDLAASSARTQDSIKILEAAGGSIKELRKQTKGFVDDATLAKNANLARVMGINQQDFGRLANMARAAAKLTGESTEFMLESIVKGTARGSKLLLDNLGILVDVKAANKAYAKQLGINVLQMTDEQKKRAFKLEVLKKEDELTQSVAKAGADQADVYDRLDTSISNLADAFGQALGPAVSSVVKPLQEVADWMREILSLSDQAAEDPSAIAMKAQARAFQLKRAQNIGSRVGLPMDATLDQLRGRAGAKPQGESADVLRGLAMLREALRAYDALNKEVGKMAVVKKRGPAAGRRRRRSGKGSGNGFAEDAAFSLGAPVESLLSAEDEADIDALGPVDLFASRRRKSQEEWKEDFELFQDDMLNVEAERIRAVNALEAQQHEDRRFRNQEAQAWTMHGINTAVNLTQSAFQMLADEQDFIMQRLGIQALSEIGNILVAEGTRYTAKGAAIMIESGGFDPRGAGLVAIGGGAIAAGIGMGAGAAFGSAHIAKLSGGGSSDSIGSSATSVRTSNSRAVSSGSDSGFNLTVVYNGVGPGADEQAKVFAKLANTARQKGFM